MSAGATGARGIVYATDGGYAHLWNAVVQDGRVNYVDFQEFGPSGPAAFDPWTTRVARQCDPALGSQQQ